MVQRKVPTKIGIKSHLLKLDTQLVNLKPSSPPSSQSHEKLKKIMKKSISIKRADESSRPKRTLDSSPTTPQKQSPNYMKSTSSFEARKEQSPTRKGSRNLKTDDSASGSKGSRISSLKKVRTLTKTTSFKPLRSSKKVVLCEDMEAQRATCSSTLKESKFPDYLQLDPGGTELDGTSIIKVCPYTYCSLNGHHHTPVPPLKSFLSSKRRALKAQKGFKLGCLSPRQTKPNVKKIEVKDPVILDLQELEEENKDFFIDIYSKDIDWEEGCCSDSCDDGLKLQETDCGVSEDGIRKMSVERLDNEHQELYDEESVSSGAWSDEDGDSASDSSKINQDYLNYDDFEVSSTAESDENDKIDEVQGLNHPVEDQNMNHQKKETVPEFAEKSKDETDKNSTTIIYNIIQFNISVFINGEKIEHSVQVPATSVAEDKKETEEAVEAQGVSNEDDEASDMNQVVTEEEVPFVVKDLASTEQLNEIENQDDPEQECHEYEASNSMYEEPENKSDVDPKHETDIKTNPVCETSLSGDELEEPGINLRDLSGKKKPSEETVDDSLEFNLRGPNFLPETPEPDAETVDLRHQTVDERKNAEEWMVDFALQQAVTTLAPARKKKVALLVEAFEKVMPDPVPTYGTHNRHTSKAFTNSRPMQACS